MSRISGNVSLDFQRKGENDSISGLVQIPQDLLENPDDLLFFFIPNHRKNRFVMGFCPGKHKSQSCKNRDFLRKDVAHAYTVHHCSP
jgi:hypothetical protein